MPGRYVREGYLDSERVNSLECAAERFYFRLYLVVDDYGRCEARPNLLKSKVFPGREDSIRVADIPRWIAICVKAGLLVDYEALGRRYLQILNFGQKTRSPSKHPPPPMLALQNNAKQCSAMLPNNEVVNDNENDKESCSERSAHSPPDSPIILEFNCAGKQKTWPLTQAKIDEYKTSFPHLDVLAECRKARQWEIDNPSKRKTFGGHPAFLSRWLGKAQNDGRAPGNPAPVKPRLPDAAEVFRRQQERDEELRKEREADRKKRELKGIA